MRTVRTACVLWTAWLAWAACVGGVAGGRELRVLQPDARSSFYVGIAAPPSAAAEVSAFNRSLAELSQTFLAGDYPLYLRNITLLPLYIELPEDERFSASVLERSCAALGRKRVAALLVCGGGAAAAAVVSAANRAGVPVVRTSPAHIHFSYTIANELLPLEIRLEITARETLHALRATLLHTHWHSFTMLVDEDIYSTLSLRKDLSLILTTQPLNPKWLSLPSKYSRHALFRRLAEISRLTRGVIVLICDINYAISVMEEANRLNILDGHFFWIWIDSTRNMDVFSLANKKELINDKVLQNLVNEKITVENKSERSKRGDMDNNYESESKQALYNSSVLISETHKKHSFRRNPFIKSKSEKSFYDEISRNLSKLEAHSVNDNLTFMNISQYSENNGNTSLKKLRYNLSLNKKSVESSKIENQSKEGKYIQPKDNNIYNSVSKMTNESFNKYVNSINLEKATKVDGDLKDNIEEKFHVDNNLYLDSVKEYIMNPTVHKTTENKRVKRSNRTDRSNFKEMLYKKQSQPMTYEKIRDIFSNFPVGLLSLNPQPMKIDSTFVRASVRIIVGALKRVLHACDAWSAQAQFFTDAFATCWEEPSDAASDFSAEFVREMKILTAAALAGGSDHHERSLTATFAFLNLVPGTNGSHEWRSVGEVIGRNVKLHTIVWPGGRLVAHGQSAGARTIFRIVTALAPPFVMEGELDEDGQCLRGLPCHRPHTSDRDNLTLAFNELERESDQDAEDFFFPTPNPTIQSKMATHCCYGLTMDLLENIAQELEFDFHLYIVEDGSYGSRKLVKPFRKIHDYKNTVKEWIPYLQNYRSIFRNNYQALNDDIDASDYIEDYSDEELQNWDGIVGDLVSGAAHMSFAAISVSSARAEVIDFSQPYFYSGISILAAPNQKPDIPLLAFLLPFSPELWIAIFTSLNITAIAVAIYEWLSPFGLNPWGRQRSKNFSISSALWVMWGLLCGHLVAFKAPKSWPNKFLINVWGGFSVIFVASYTANIAALIAGLFFYNSVDDFQGRKNWLSLRVGTAKSSVSEYYVQRNNPTLSDQMYRFGLRNIEEGIAKLRNGTLDLLIADTPVLDYYRATDHGCKLQKVGDQTLADDSYAIAMTKGFPLKDSISATIAKYSSNGYMDILTEKWYGGLPCFKHGPDYGIQPKPLGVAAVAGVFILLGVGMVIGCLILVLEHLFYRYTLPVLRHQPKGTIWRSRNIMFFSQKLYRFINCVDLVSPHHAARELISTIRQGHFTSLFQKSVKRELQLFQKEHEQRRRRKSKAQFFEMIQEIRRVQQGRDHSLDSIKEHSAIESSEMSEEPTELKLLSPSPDVASRSPRQSRSPRPQRSPKGKRKKSVAGLNVRRFSTDSVLGSDSGSLYERTSLNIGRRLSRDVSCLTNSPPDINTRLRTPSPMVRRAEGSSTRSYQDVSDRTEEKTSATGTNSHASVEILISHDDDMPPVPPYPRRFPIERRIEATRECEQELLNLWRSTNHELRDALLTTLRENHSRGEVAQDPG